MDWTSRLRSFINVIKYVLLFVLTKLNLKENKKNAGRPYVKNRISLRVGIRKFSVFCRLLIMLLAHAAVPVL